MIEDFLQIADELARRETGKPKQASLRRAVTTAYYAVFHALAELCAGSFVGWKNPWNVYTPIYRSLEHQKARSVFTSARGNRQTPPEMVRIATSYINLQDARNLADYDPQPRLNRAQVLDLVETARQAVQAIQRLPSSLALELAVRLVAKPR